MKQFAERGLDKAGIKMIATGDVTDDDQLNDMGDGALGVVTSHHYSAAHPSAANKKFVEAFEGQQEHAPQLHGRGRLRRHARRSTKRSKTTRGKGGGDALLAAMKGQVFESPRGPVLIDAQTRDIVQDVYLRKVEKKDGQLYNVEFDVIKAVEGPGQGQVIQTRSLHANGCALATAACSTILFDGIAYGMLLFVLAVGLAVTLGLMNFINLAHGAFAMAGGYLTVFAMQKLGVPFLACLAARLRRGRRCRGAARAHAVPADVRQAAPRPGAVLDRPGLHGGGGHRLLRRLVAAEHPPARVAARAHRDRRRRAAAGHGPLPALHHRACAPCSPWCCS